MGFNIKFDKIKMFLFFTLFFTSCYKYNSESWYEISEDVLINNSNENNKNKNIYDKLKLSIELEYPTNLKIQGCTNKNLQIEEIRLYFEKNIVGKVVVQKNISTLPDNQDGTKNYSLNNFFYDKLGRNNEKYNVSSGRFMQDGFQLFVIIKDNNTKEKYSFQKNIVILFHKKGFEEWSISI